MRQPLRFFAVGLLVASILLYGYYFFFVSSNVEETEMETDELIAQVEDEGYRVISEDEYLSYTFLKQQEEEEKKDDEKDKKETEKDKSKEEDKDKEKDDKKEENEKEEDEQEDNNNEVKEHTFTTSDNVVSQDVADELIDNGIIDDRQAFLDYLNDNDYSSYVQIGTFTVSSDMSFKELAEIITTYPGN